MMQLHHCRPTAGLGDWGCRYRPWAGRNEAHGRSGPTRGPHGLGGVSDEWCVDVDGSIPTPSREFSTFGATERQTLMNQYGALAQSHWQKYRPQEYASLTDPKAFFQDLGDQVAQMVNTTLLSSEAAEAETLKSLEYLERVGLLNALRKSAEEQALAELVFLPVEQQTSDAPWEPEPRMSGPTGERVMTLDSLGRWLLPEEERLEELARRGATLDEDDQVMPADRTHPLWQLNALSDREDATPEDRARFLEALRTWLVSIPGLVELAY